MSTVHNSPFPIVDGTCVVLRDGTVGVVAIIGGGYPCPFIYSVGNRDVYLPGKALHEAEAWYAFPSKLGHVPAVEGADGEARFCWSNNGDDDEDIIREADANEYAEAARMMPEFADRILKACPAPPELLAWYEAL